MAAYGALVSLWNDLELIPNHPTHSFSFESKQIASLSQIVDSLIHFMDTNTSHGEAARILESRIASAAHAAHDVIESQVVDQIHAGTTLAGRSRSFFLLDLQKAIDDLEFVKRKAMQFKQKSGSKVEQLARSARASSSEPPTSEKNVMVGFDAAAVRLMGKLTGDPSGQRIILPIVGMGGIGKTTLAKNAFENLYCEHRFDVRRWATISQEYNVETILSELFYGDRISSSGENVHELGEQLHKMLWGRRYLIVLDDMWSVEAWDEIQRFLPDNENGSCVVVTTRLSNMAAHLSSSSPFEMDFLDNSQSWELFCGTAFGEKDCPTELVEFGKKIVGRCRGLPLSIVVIGGHLKRSSRAIEYWEMVANLINPISGLGEDEQCLKIIHLSYEHLPARLKPCFLYLGIFREVKWISASKLVNFWIAEGFVRNCRSLCLEEAAEGYLKDLINRNLIRANKKRWDGKVQFCVIHDTVRELCLKVGNQEKFLGVLDTTAEAAIGEHRRIVVGMELASSLRQKHSVGGGLQLPSKLRSIISHREGFLDELLVNFRLLRLSTYDVHSDRCYVSTSFQNVNLRFLTFYVHAAAGTLPYSIRWSISLLWSMQTLIIVNGDFSDVVLPYEIWKMTQLRHLESVKGGCRLPDLDLSYGGRPNQQECIVLENLRTLLGVMDLRWTDEVCRRIPNIKKLGLSYYGIPDEYDCSYYSLHNLGRLNKLESLQCSFGFESTMWRGDVRSFVLPTSLEELTLNNCDWEILTKAIKSLPRLGYLQLWCVRGPEWDLAEEEFEFPRLKTLKIYGCGDLIHWNANNSHFPILEELLIEGAHNLSEIPLGIGEIPTLELIHLYECSVSAAVSAMRIVSEQESLGNEDIILDVDFWRMEEVESFRSMVQQECLTINTLHLYCAFKKIII